jgi:hypothetical protein
MGASDCDRHPANPYRDGIAREQSPFVQCLNRSARIKAQFTQAPTLTQIEGRPVNMGYFGHLVQWQLIQSQMKCPVQN